MNKPNFFIAGAPKSGTSALYSYLRGHPHIFMPELKEPHYWCLDFPKIRLIRTMKDYRKLFESATSQHKAIGEASVTYLGSKVALQQIAEFHADARIIIMLRNPVDMVYAFHKELLWNQNEDEQDFEKAWHLQARRKAGTGIPRTCRESTFLQYRDCASYGEQMERLYNVFPRHQVKVFLFDEFVASPRTVYEAALDFLGVAPDRRSEFPTINESKEARSRLLARLVTRPPNWVSEAVRQLKSTLGVRHLGISDLYMKLNKKPVARKPLSPGVRTALASEFREDIEKLEFLIGRELTSWR